MVDYPLEHYSFPVKALINLSLQNTTETLGDGGSLVEEKPKTHVGTAKGRTSSAFDFFSLKNFFFEMVLLKP